MKRCKTLKKKKKLSARSRNNLFQEAVVANASQPDQQEESPQMLALGMVHTLLVGQARCSYYL